MPRDYAKYVFINNRKSKTSLPAIILIVCASLVITGSLLYYILFHKNHFNKPDLASWFSFMKKHKAVKATEPKKVVAKAAADEVHFDFYDQLPKMKVALSDVPTDGGVKPPEIKEVAQNNVPQVDPYADEIPEVKKTQLVTPIKTTATVISSTEVEKTLLNEFDASLRKVSKKRVTPIAPIAQAVFKRQGCVLQFGLFRNSPDATRLKTALLNEGIHADIKKIRTGLDAIYRVQKHYQDSEVARDVAHQLKIKGINGINLKKLG